MESARNVIHTEAILILLRKGGSLTKRNHAGKTCVELLAEKDGAPGLFSSFLKEIAPQGNDKLLCDLEEAVSVILVLESKNPKAARQGWELRLSSIRDLIESFESSDIVLVRLHDTRTASNFAHNVELTECSCLAPSVRLQRYVKSVRTWMDCVDITAETIRRHLEALQQCGFSVTDSSETLSVVLSLRQSDASFELLRGLLQKMQLNLSEVKMKRKSIGKGYWNIIVSLADTSK
jgi:hypothetical protein